MAPTIPWASETKRPSPGGSGLAQLSLPCGSELGTPATRPALPVRSPCLNLKDLHACGQTGKYPTFCF